MCLLYTDCDHRRRQPSYWSQRRGRSQMPLKTFRPISRYHTFMYMYTQLNHTHQPTMECYTFSPSSNRLSLTQQVAQEKETTESKWKQERQRRIRTEKRLRLAEDSLKRLDKALKESGVQIDIQIETDVKHLKSKFSYYSVSHFTEKYLWWNMNTLTISHFSTSAN